MHLSIPHIPDLALSPQNTLGISLMLPCIIYGALRSISRPRRHFYDYIRYFSSFSLIFASFRFASPRFASPLLQNTLDIIYSLFRTLLPLPIVSKSTWEHMSAFSLIGLFPYLICLSSLDLARCYLLSLNFTHTLSTTKTMYLVTTKQ